MTPDYLSSYLAMSKTPTSWKNCFDAISQSYKSNWLDHFSFDEILTFYSFDETFKNRFWKEIHLLKSNTTLNFVCYLFYYLLFLVDNKEDYYDIWSWESTSKTFCNHGSYMICVISLLCGYSYHVSNLNKCHFDVLQIKHQKENIKFICTNGQKSFGLDGIRFSQMIWGSFFMKGKLIQIGRLQYEVDVENFSKLSHYFDKKTNFVFIHIPKGEKLEIEEVKSSIKNSKKALLAYYPDLYHQNLVYFTQSWLLSPELKDVLPTNSNILKFQELFEIVEYEEYIPDFLKFVFEIYFTLTDYKNLPEKTTLQKGLKKHLLENKTLHLGLGFLNQ